MRLASETFRVLRVDLATGRGTALEFGAVGEILGGSGLASALFERFGDLAAPWNAPEQPIIFAVGPLTGAFPLMSKCVCGFKSPYNGQYAESHAGGRLALCLRFSGYHALVLTGQARVLSSLTVGSRSIELADVHWLRGQDVFATGKLLRRVGGAGSSGHRSILRIGPAGENGAAYACINVDTYRHFGRLGSGAVLGAKNVKAVTVVGDADFALPEGREYPKLFKRVFDTVTATDKMRKYHDLGTPANLAPLNRIKSLPWRNLQATSDEGIDGVTGETLAEQLLLRQTACAGCPVGCIHIGLLRQQFAKDHEYLYRQVNYDYESIYAQGTMLGMTNASDVLALLDETEKVGLDVMSAGVALAWATEAMQRGLIGEAETGVPLAFGDLNGYLAAMRRLGAGAGEFYRLLGKGVLRAAEAYGGEDFACVLGQEMAGYATGELFYVAQSHGFRHSHLDCGAYAWDQEHAEHDVEGAVRFLVEDERARLTLCCMVGCLFARGAYPQETLQEALASLGLREAADNLERAALGVQKKRWSLKFRTGYDPARVRIPKRFLEVTTWKGTTDPEYLRSLSEVYSAAIRDLADDGADDGAASGTAPGMASGIAPGPANGDAAQGRAGRAD
ncbi:MAG: aldehyde ferredoxin oxidoreductase [Desulfovibrionaceae bacterium]|jgi:aldehyde:ferredoxin oxidoreductase|nr:aldehyde ferredoxin oxidoreductase [Desulfovibrionaceae bacterium]